MELLAEDVDGNVVLEVRGRVDSLTAPALQDQLTRALQTPDTGVIVDLTRVEYLSSAGLRALLVAMQQAQKVHGKLVLHGLNERVREVFEISGFISILTVCTSRDDALALMQP